VHVEALFFRPREDWRIARAHQHLPMAAGRQPAHQAQNLPLPAPHFASGIQM
jgi:hypothetical protein